MAEVRVRFPLGALNIRVRESLAFRVLREHEIAGSNPAILTDVFDAVALVLVRADATVLPLRHFASRLSAAKYLVATPATTRACLSGGADDGDGRIARRMLSQERQCHGCVRTSRGRTA